MSSSPHFGMDEWMTVHEINCIISLNLLSTVKPIFPAAVTHASSSSFSPVLWKRTPSFQLHLTTNNKLTWSPGRSRDNFLLDSRNVVVYTQLSGRKTSRSPCSVLSNKHPSQVDLKSWLHSSSLPGVRFPRQERVVEWVRLFLSDWSSCRVRDEWLINKDARLREGDKVRKNWCLCEERGSFHCQEKI